MENKKKPANRVKTGERGNNGRFVKGVSGNPSGRPPQPEEVKELIKASTVPAVQLLIDTMNDSEIKPDLRVKCAEILIDRALGKAVTPIETSVIAQPFDWTEITTEELRRLAKLEDNDSESGEE